MYTPKPNQPRQLGEFLLEELLQAGRLTEVWVARWLRAPQPAYERVALKILRTELIRDPVAIERFNNEIRATAQLRHPHIAAPITWGMFEDGRRYFASQFVPGRPLSRWIGQPLPVDFTLHVLTRLAEGLDYVHRRGIVHRDVKPENVLITDEGKPYLIDFSIALSREVVRLTRVGDLVGTVAYMAPELLTNQPISHATDVYSLGVMAFEMLTGTEPFQGNSWEVTYQHVNKNPPSATSFNPTLPPAADLCLQRAMSKQAAQRPQSAGAFVRELQAAISGVPVATDFSRFLPVLLGGGLGIVLLLIILASMS